MPKDGFLPPRPGEAPVPKNDGSPPFALYINGDLVQMSKTEALGLLAQISQILCYLDSQELPGGK